MKKLSTFGIVAALMIMLASCSHTSSNSTPANTYTFKSTTYTPTVVVASSSSLQASNYTSSSVILVFTSFPTTSGTYQVATGTSPANANQVAVNFANLTTSATYAAVPSGTVNATVTVAGNGKITVVIPTVTLAAVGNSSDTGPFTANLTQQ